MAIKRLSELKDWKLRDKNQDIRGYKLCRHGGDCLGRIDDLMVNTDNEVVESVVLDDGQRFSADELDIEGDTVYLGSTTAGAGKTGTTHEMHRGVRVYPRDTGETRPRAE